MKRGFRRGTKTLLPFYVTVATNPNAGQAHDADAPSNFIIKTPSTPHNHTPAVTAPTTLEMDLKQTKLTMGNAIVKLVKKVKKLEEFVKRRNLVLGGTEKTKPSTLEVAKTLSKVGICRGHVNTDSGVNTASIKLKLLVLNNLVLGNEQDLVLVGAVKSTSSPDNRPKEME
ncbi:hypothetical protein Tco_1577613 [Tanacetum coccineum]